jgi:hypothetical protein
LLQVEKQQAKFPRTFHHHFLRLRFHHDLQADIIIHLSLSTMTVYRSFLIASLLVASASAWSYQSLQKQANIMAQTRRDPIQMPTQTPMVPYKVS